MKTSSWAVIPALGLVLAGCQLATQLAASSPTPTPTPAPSATPTPTPTPTPPPTPALTVASPVSTKLYGFSNGASFTLPLPLSFTTTEASVEYSLNGGSWTAATNNLDLSSSTLLLAGFNTLDVRAKNASGTVTVTNPTVTFVQWTPSNNLSPSQTATGHESGSWSSGAAVTDGGNGANYFTTYNTDSAHPYTSGTALSSAGQALYNATTNPNGGWSQLGRYPIAGVATATGFLAGRLLASLGAAPSSSASQDTTVTYVGMAGYDTSTSTSGSLFAYLGQGSTGPAFVGLVLVDGGTYSTLGTTASAPALDFSLPAQTGAAMFGARYELIFLKDHAKYLAALLDMAVPLTPGNQPTDVPTIVAQAFVDSPTIAHPNTLSGVALADKNTTSTVTATPAFFSAWY
jgi:hypothetical protein